MRAPLANSEGTAGAGRPAPRVVVAEGASFVRLAIRMALAADGIRIDAEVATAPQAVAEAVARRAEVVLLDAGLDPELTAVEALVAERPEVAVVMLSADSADGFVLAALRAGARGVVDRDIAPERLPGIVRGAAAGEAVLSRMVVGRLLADLRSGALAAPGGLTPREREVLEQVAAGAGDRAIGERLALSEVTVRRHVASAMRKLGSRHRAEAVAVLRGLSSTRVA